MVTLPWSGRVAARLLGRKSVVETSEREMVRSLERPDEQPEERFTSLQPTYEDSVPPADEWDEDE